MNTVELLVGLVIVVGLVGIVVPVLPGSILVVGATLVWAVYAGTGTAWAFFSVAATLVVLGQALKYLFGHRSLRTAGVPPRSIVLGGLGAIVGFFVVPVVGLVLGFVVGIYLGELQRIGRPAAWPSTVVALKAVGLSLLVELTAGLLAAGTWLLGAVVV